MVDLFRDTFLGFVRAHLLWHACRERIFGAEMIEELRRHGHEMSPGTLYPILHAMHEAGLLEAESESEGGHVRKYYRTTPAGREALVALQSRIRELSREVLRDIPPDPRQPARPIICAVAISSSSSAIEAWPEIA